MVLVILSWQWLLIDVSFSEQLREDIFYNFEHNMENMVVEVTLIWSTDNSNNLDNNGDSYLWDNMENGNTEFAKKNVF